MAVDEDGASVHSVGEEGGQGRAGRVVEGELRREVDALLPRDRTDQTRIVVCEAEVVVPARKHVHRFEEGGARRQKTRGALRVAIKILEPIAGCAWLGEVVPPR